MLVIKTERIKMNLLKKILMITAKIIAGICAFYLLLSLIIIPLIAPWIIRGKASKITGHEVKVRSVQFNPFLLKLKIKGVEILDDKNDIIAGFDKLWADISFISLLKKKYHIESLGISGLKVNAVLLADGGINLLELVPQKEGKPVEEVSTQETENSQAQQAEIKEKKAVPEAESKGSSQLPLVVVDIISMDNGQITFSDQSLTPNFLTTLSDITLNITDVSTEPDSQAKISFKAKLDEKGIITDEALIKPFAKPLSLETVFKLNDYVLKVLTPYVGKYTGRTAKSGKLNLTMEYRIEDNKLDAAHKILVQGFDFGDKVESPDALNLPFGLALGLLEDSQNRINISLPVDGDMSDPDFHYFQVVGQVAKSFFFKIVTKPFSFLVSAIGSEGGSEEYGYISFLPGSTDLSDAEKEKIRLILQALKERPNLALAVKRCYDPVADWRAIKREVFDNDFAAMKKETTRSEDVVYERMYKNRFGTAAIWKLTKKYRLKDGKYDFPKINKEIKRQLVEDGSADKVALEALAELRAKNVYDFIVAEGFVESKLSTGKIQENQASAGFVPVELELKLFDSSAESSDDPILPAEVK